ncbi:carbamate kinase [Oceanobacillus neutriphilus]|uniref:Carbamate kinase n=1 Tax=Oceanobacillus neutriphilus TaxID=531815 RepID=A0ABQ2NUE7_9BACI|nr:carbamate kinase [Oceanobacillus neutriphilus]GGP10789.1 carbamate kinase [Oceanobacillus neutriphilus]
MEKKTIVVALGGNAILTDNPTADAQKEAIKNTCEQLVSLFKAGHKIIITHGNGPQVGNLLLQQSAADSEKNSALPLDSCVAMTQGSIGFWLQNALRDTLKREGIEKEVVSLVTQVEVSPKDEAFEHPTKPIGPFLSQEKAEEESRSLIDQYVEDAGRGWRKVVPSPRPISIVEHNIIKQLVDNDISVIACGGGGVPTIQSEKELEGVEAVIDKDFAAAKLAELVHADYLVILTGVDYVYVDFNKPTQRRLEEITIDELKQFMRENQFAGGSMLPKIEAAIQFMEATENGKTIITSLKNAKNLFNSKSVTTVLMN